MNIRTLVALTGALALGELISAAIIWTEDNADAQPWFAVVFAALFTAGAAVIRSGRVFGGAILVSALCLFELITFPSWERNGALDWAYQVSYAAISLACLVTAITVLVSRQRSSVPT
jgi:hypothetical protein